MCLRAELVVGTTRARKEATVWRAIRLVVAVRPVLGAARPVSDACGSDRRLHIARPVTNPTPKVLIAVDGSPDGLRAVDHVATIGRTCRNLTPLHVVGPGTFRAPGH